MIFSKFAPKLPECPYCSTVYRYSDVRKALSEKSTGCYNCKKHFRRKKQKLIFLAAELILLGIAVDIAAIMIFSKLNLISLFIINIVLVIIGFLLIPYYTEFSAEKSLNQKLES